ncbi:hypothetical protein EsH8_IX_000195 [Colletotrichum jinshuiense]
MPSSKGKPTDPELREELKEGRAPPAPAGRVADTDDGCAEIKQEPNKSGGGEGQWSAWKATKLAKEYEKQGGDYENEAGSKNEPKKGEPEKKSADKRKAETGEYDGSIGKDEKRAPPRLAHAITRAMAKGACE